MESNTYPEEALNSFQFEAYREDIDSGIGRFYECIFCKRGFNTAQALGGHMNIHRKDRARDEETWSKQLLLSVPRLYQNIPPPASSNDRISNNDQCNSANPHILSCDQQLCSCCCSACFLGSNSSTKPLSGSNGFLHQQPEKRRINGRDSKARLSSELPPVTIDELKLKMSEGVISGEELDLELRLGYDS